MLTPNIYLSSLIALMLGRLRMDTIEALESYNRIASMTFSPSNKKKWPVRDGLFKATTFQKEIEKIVAAKKLGEVMLDELDGTIMGRAFVCATPAKNQEHTRRFRSYRVRNFESTNCKIWEAARATTADPRLFKRICIGEEGQAQEEFVDGGLRCNNPTWEVIEEARNIFGDTRAVGCLVSIGTGHPGTIGLPKPNTSQKFFPTKLIDTLKMIATDCENAVTELDKRFHRAPGLYFRFNVTHGAEGISLDEWNKMSDMITHTKAYFERNMVSSPIDKVVRLLCQPSDVGITLSHICQSQAPVRYT